MRKIHAYFASTFGCFVPLIKFCNIVEKSLFAAFTIFFISDISCVSYNI